MKLVFTYLFLINAAGFLIMLIDKQKARKNRWRIPERVLIGIATVGGSFGIMAGMRIFRHKTRHEKFTVGVPVILALQILFAVFIYILL